MSELSGGGWLAIATFWGLATCAVEGRAKKQLEASVERQQWENPRLMWRAWGEGGKARCSKDFGGCKAGGVCVCVMPYYYF